MNLITSLRTLLLALALSIGVSYTYAAWTAPTQTPPLGNIDAPVNVGAGSQTKTGPLWVGGILSSAGGYIAGNLEVVGNVGIGTASPIGPLTIDNTTGTPWIDIRSNGDANNYSAISLWSNEGGSWGSPDKRWAVGHRKLAGEKNNFFIEECTQPGSCVNGTGTYNQRLTIKPGGNTGIGQKNPTEKLDVNGNVKATAFLYSSDRNLKENIQSLSPDVLAKVLQLQGVSYTWKDTGNKSMGLIAQDVEKVFPELVSTDPTTGLKSLQYAGLTAPLIEALKQQQAQIDELKAQIKELQAK